VAEQELSPSAKLCLSCGLCCNGALFPHAYFVFGENLSHWQENGFDLVKEDGSVFFELGCPHLDGAACTIYDKPRPHTCGGFRCNPLQRLEDGEIELDQAFETVGKAVSQASDVRAVVRKAGKDISARNFYTLSEVLENEQSDEDSPRQTAIKLAIEKLNAFENYANEHLMPAHVLEELERDTNA